MRLALGGARIAVGAAAWLMPAFTTPAASGSAPSRPIRMALWLRGCSRRDFVLGGAVLAGPHPEALSRARAGLVVDVADIAAAIVGLHEGGNRASTLIVGGGTATLAAMGGVLLFTTQRS